MERTFHGIGIFSFLDLQKSEETMEHVDKKVKMQQFSLLMSELLCGKYRGDHQEVTREEMGKINRRSMIRYVCLLIFFAGSILLLRSCRSLWYDFELSYTSPQGTNTIIVKYDFVSRPSIFKKGFLWDKKIWQYENSGFMETVTFGVEWISEDQIRFTYDDIYDQYDEEYMITIPIPFYKRVFP